MNCVKIFFGFTIALMLSGCNNPPLPFSTPPSNQTATNSPLMTPTTGVEVHVIKGTISPTLLPVKGVATVVGRLVRRYNSSPIADTSIYLARAQWNADRTDGIFALDVNVAPSSKTLTDGTFTFAQVQPGEYVLVVGSIYANPIIVSNPNGTARVFEIPSGKVTDFGELVIPFFE
jgi:hypothetical protein